MSERPARRSWRQWTARAVVCCAGALILAAGGYLVAAASLSDGPTSVPSCSWPLRARGPVTREQAGLVRCYLRALAASDMSGMLAVADTSEGPLRITGAAFAHAADARSGTASATFRPNDTDSAYIDVSVAFADGAHADVSMELANPASAHSWRMDIGTYPPDPSAPPPLRQNPDHS